MARYDESRAKYLALRDERRMQYAKIITDIIIAITYDGYDHAVKTARKLASENVGEVLDKKKNEYVPDRALIETKSEEYLAVARDEITNLMSETPTPSARVMASIAKELKVIGTAQRYMAANERQKVIDYINSDAKLSERLCLKLVSIVEGDNSGETAVTYSSLKGNPYE